MSRPVSSGAGPRKRVFVVGGGIVGLSCALYAQRNGHDVIVADPRGFAKGASYGNAGVIANSECIPVATPGVLRQVPRMLLAADSPLTIRWAYAARIAPWLLRFVRASSRARVAHATGHLAALLARAMPGHRELAADAGCDQLIKEVGWLKVFQTDAAYRQAQSGFDSMRAHGVDCEYLDRRALAQREPGLAAIFAHGILHKDCAQIEDPGRYVEALGALFLRRGGQFVQSEVEALERSDGRIDCARTGTERYQADCFVVAAGAWSKKLAADAGARVPLDTERGYHVVMETGEPQALRQPVYWAEKSVVMSPSSQRLRVTSSVEFAGLQAAPDYRKLKAIVPAIRAAVAAEPGKVVGEWLGFRPSMPDSLPVISRAPRAANCVLAFGHGHIGLTTGPATGAIVAALIDGAPPPMDITAFSAERFG